MSPDETGIIKLKLLEDNDFQKGAPTGEQINQTNFNVANILTKSDRSKNLLDDELRNISISEQEFNEKVIGKIKILTFPELSIKNPYHNSFHKKLKEILPRTEIIFKDDDGFEYRRGTNEIYIDIQKFYLDGNNKKLNLSILKLLKSEPDKEKIKLIDSILPNRSNLFVSDDLCLFNSERIILEKGNLGDPIFQTNRIKNSTQYLNAIYNSKKIMGTFVSGQYNLMEPLHAGILTINSYSQNHENINRLNHNWLATHFGEKAGLLLLLNGDSNDYEKLQKFKNISHGDFLERKKIFEYIYENEIKPLVYGVIYKFLKTKFPNEITN
ncbi:MAG: hypothetical protein PHR68_03610 [Candidatus Gracilibacteria bacterium]|nr:hypothetical protein [Candidatus Gracilibacteria bacterium]